MNNGKEIQPFRQRNFDDSAIKTIANPDLDSKVTSIMQCGATCANRGLDTCQGFLWNPELGDDNCRLVDFYQWASPKHDGDTVVYTLLH